MKKVLSSTFFCVIVFLSKCRELYAVIVHNNVNQPDILFASALKMTGYLRR